MNKPLNWACALAFLTLCGGVTAFLHIFTQVEGSFDYPIWEAAAVISPDGSEATFDPDGPFPALGTGEQYRVSLTLPESREEGTWAVFEAGDLEAAVFLDGQELWRSSSVQATDTVNLTKVQLPLPAGGGEVLTMDLRPLAETGLFPPLLRLTKDPADQAGAIGYANLYGIPAGASALAMVLLWGLFLLGLSSGRRDWKLLLPVVAAGALTAHRISIGYGVYFLPQPVWEFLNGRWLENAAALAFVFYLTLQRRREFWRALGTVAAWSAGGLLVTALISWLRDGYLCRYLVYLVGELRAGIYDGMLYWVTLWLVLICSMLSAWELARSIAHTQGEAQALALRNRLVVDNYRALERKVRESAALRHEFRHRLLAMDAMLQARDLEGLERCVAAWKGEDGMASQLLYTNNIPINAILQDFAGRAQEAGVDFKATVIVPEELPFPDEDLCTLLMNLLDNALEGTARLPEKRQRSIVFKVRVFKGVLVVLCENTFDGRVKTDERGKLLTTKEGPESHGFGLIQMRAVAEKYGSTLDVRYTDEHFTVQTALGLPKEEQKSKKRPSPSTKYGL